MVAFGLIVTTSKFYSEMNRILFSLIGSCVFYKIGNILIYSFFFFFFFFFFYIYMYIAAAIIANFNFYLFFLYKIHEYFQLIKNIIFSFIKYMNTFNFNKK